MNIIYRNSFADNKHNRIGGVCMLKRVATYVILIVVSLFAEQSMAQLHLSGTDTLSFEIHFRLDKHNLDLLYYGNNKVFTKMAEKIDSIGLGKIDSVVIVSQSSPEGPYKRNQNLSHNRAAAMRSYMQSNHPKLESRLATVPDGESWLQLRGYIVRDSMLTEVSKRRLLQVIDDNSVTIEEKKRRMAKDDAYDYIYSAYYPIIRNSQIQIVYRKPIPPIAPVNVEFSPFEIPKIECNLESLPYQRNPRILRDTLVVAAKTNLLYDAITALNFELELPIGNHWSVAVEDVFPWWEKDNKYCFQMWEMGAEARYWFRDNVYYADKLRGHFVGAYAMSSKFDFQNDYDICYQGEYWSTGLTYGYAMKLTRHLNMEFSISVGWLSSAYRHYYPEDDYSQLWRDKTKVGRINYFGPTKLKVALVWPMRIPYKKMGGKL